MWAATQYVSLSSSVIMTSLKLSLYGYLFNATVRAFDLDATVANFLSFADEVVIATLAQQEDDTLERLLKHEDALEGRLKVVVVDMDIKRNNRFDGDLKTAALQACTHPIRIIADCDERFLVSQRPAWDDFARALLADPRIDGWLIPVVDLYGREDSIRADQPLGVKFRMHKDTIVRRGVPRYAERANGLIDPSQSDTTEPLRADGNVGQFAAPFPQHLLSPSLCHMLGVYVLHYGYLDFRRRVELGRTFWREHWERRSGHEERVPTRVEDLMDVPVVPHRLKLI